MKKLFLTVLALAFAVFSAAGAHAETTPGWYAAAGVGVGFPIDPTLKLNGVKTKGTYENTTLDALGGFGYAFDNGIRLETEYFYNKKDIKTLAGVARGGHVTSNVLFFNALYDFNNDTIFTPYIGAGIGPDFVQVNNVGTTAASLDGGDIVFAYQGIVGVSAQLDRNWAMTADYRYVGSTDPKVDYTVGTKGTISNASHNMILGLRYSFGVCADAIREVSPPAVPAMAVEKPVVAPVEQNFMVFFDFDKFVVTPEAKKIIAAAAKQFKKDGFVKIVVTGHTDTVGTEAYNQKLSERRARAVRKELQKNGVKKAVIKEVGAGKKSLLVPTTDGVREAQNRRAEIVLEK